jgi:hypothetical protein
VSKNGPQSADQRICNDLHRPRCSSGQLRHVKRASAPVGAPRCSNLLPPGTANRRPPRLLWIFRRRLIRALSAARDCAGLHTMIPLKSVAFNRTPRNVRQMTDVELRHPYAADVGRLMNPGRLYLLGVALSAGIAILANLLTPGRFTTLAATLTILAPLATILIVDRLATRREVYDLRQETLTNIREAGATSGQVITLSSGDAWVRYVERNAVGAKAVYNTRLSDFRGLYDTYHDRVDDILVKAIQSGTEYNFICSEFRRDSLDVLKKRLIDRNTTLGGSAGKVRAYVLQTGGRPLLQMKIFDYHGGYSEAMIGFVALSARDASQPIFLVRNPGLVEYLRHVFYSYCEAATSEPMSAG